MYTKVSGDIMGIKYIGSFATNYISVIRDTNAADLLDDKKSHVQQSNSDTGSGTTLNFRLRS